MLAQRGKEEPNNHRHLKLTCMRKAVWVGLRITPKSCRTPFRSDAATLQSSTVPGSPPDSNTHGGEAGGDAAAALVSARDGKISR